VGCGYPSESIGCDGSPVRRKKEGRDFSFEWDDPLRVEVLVERLKACGIECGDDSGLPWLWGRIPVLLLPTPDGIALVSIKDFRQGVSLVERRWFASRLKMLQPWVDFYCTGGQLVAEAIVECEGLPALGKLISCISYFEGVCLNARGPLVEGLLHEW